MFDKTGIIEFCTFLQNTYQVEIISTGGTASSLRSAGLTITDVSDYTHHPECFDGRVKTLHPKIHGEFLAVRGNTKHKEEMQQYHIPPIDMTIVNLYPFEQTIQNNDNSYEQCMENIDIGGPSMIRSTAKNHVSTTIVTSSSQYAIIQQCLLQHNGCTTYALRQSFAYAAYALTASYDSRIAQYMQQQVQFQQQSSSNNHNTNDVALIATTPTNVPVIRVYEPQLTLKY
jgi:phosphoribosylaminoimidazolecarboxamide formyltransferase / IMP cyclohydrolase